MLHENRVHAHEPIVIGGNLTRVPGNTSIDRGTKTQLIKLRDTQELADFTVTQYAFFFLPFEITQA